MATALQNLAPDNTTADNFSVWCKALSAQLAALGLVKTGDTGQISFDGPTVSASSSDANAAYAVANAFDVSVSNAWRSAALPTAGAPQWVMFDAGNGQTFTPRSYGIYSVNAPNDPQNVVLQSADAPAGPWADVDTQMLPLSLGYQTFNVPSAPAKRCYRLLISSVQGGAGYVQLTEFQLWTVAGLNGTRAVPVSLKPTAANQVFGYEMWRMNGALQNTAPCFLKIEYGAGAAVNYPGLWLTCASATDGAGNLGEQVSERKQLRSASSATTTQSCAFSGANNRAAAAMFLNHAAYFWFAWERSRDGTGAETNEGQFLIAGSGYEKFQMWVPFAGAVPPTDTDYGCIGPTGATGLRGSAVGLYPIKPFGPDEKSPMLSAVGYFNSDIAAMTPVTGVKIFGQTADRTILPLGGNIVNVLRANANSRLALLWE